MKTYEDLLTVIARNIKFLNKKLEEYYEFEEKANSVGASIKYEDSKKYTQLEYDIAMFEKLANGMDIEFESELEQASATLTIE